MMGGANAMRRIVQRIGIGALGPILACGLLAGAKTPPGAFLFPLSVASRLSFDGDIRGTPSVANGRLFFGTDRGYVYALAAGDPPSVAWRYAAKAALAGSPALGGPGLLIADAANRIYLLDPDTGRLRWAIGLTGRITAGPCWGPGDAALVAVDDAVLLAFDVRGFDKWRFAPATPLRGGPALVGGEIAIATAEGGISILAADGRPDRSLDAGGAIAAPVFAEADRLFASRGDGDLVCLDPLEGKKRWTVRLGAVLAAPPAAASGRLYVIASNAVLFCLDEARGDLVWWHSLPAKSPFPAWVGEGLAVAAARSPILTGFKADTGDKAGTQDAGSELRAGVARLGDRLAAATYDAEAGTGTIIFLKGEPPKAAPNKK